MDQNDCKEPQYTLDLSRGCHFCGKSEQTSAQACPGCYKLHATDWLEEMPDIFPDDIFEVRFKNTRKSYFRNANNLPLKRGDVVAVEASPGHDIGIVSLTGDLVARQMRRVNFSPLNGEFKKIYRIAKPADIVKWQEAIALEHTTMIRSRQIAAELGLNMKIGDVEFQGDKIKAIFYYIADERVDFRELIKIFAGQFHIRIEMKQIGARQEAGRIGGLGSCGRELCCASWVSSFVSVTTNSARHQEISLNPQKLAGQCGKLKCCLIYELDTYLDARKEIPRLREPLRTLDGEYFLVKTDILSHTMWFSSDPHSLVGMRPLSVSRVKEIMHINAKGEKAEQLEEQGHNSTSKTEEPSFANVVGSDSLTRFDKPSSGGARRKGQGGRGRGRAREGGEREDRSLAGLRTSSEAGVKAEDTKKQVSGDRRSTHANEGGRTGNPQRENRGDRPRRTGNRNRRPGGAGQESAPKEGQTTSRSEGQINRSNGVTRRPEVDSRHGRRAEESGRSAAQGKGEQTPGGEYQSPSTPKTPNQE